MAGIDWDKGSMTPPAGGDSQVDWESGAMTPPNAKPAGFVRRAADQGIKLAQGVVGVPETAVGLADLVTGGRAGKAVEDAGVRFKEAKDIMGEYLSPEQKAADAEVNQAKGFFPTIGAMVKNPSTIVGAAMESAPSMLSGGVAARGLLKVAPKIGAVAAGAAGEGIVTAGQNTEQVRQETPGGLLPDGAEIPLAASGALTGVIGGVSGKVANKLGIGDVQTMLAAGKLGPVGQDAIQAGVKKSLPRKIGEGILTEGVLQELPQSYQEQVGQNIAQSKPWDEGAVEAGAHGMMAGGLMGGGANMVAHFGEKQGGQPLASAPNPAPPGPAAPAPRLGFNPLAGTSTVFPDGSIVLNSESDAGQQAILNKRYAPQPIDPVRQAVKDAADAGGSLSAAAGVAMDSGAAPAAQGPNAGQPLTEAESFNLIPIDEASDEDRRAYEAAFDKPAQPEYMAMSADQRKAILYGNKEVSDGGKEFAGTQDGDILNGMSAPFKTRFAAARRAHMMGKNWTIAQVEDGFVARWKDPAGTAIAQDAPAAVKAAKDGTPAGAPAGQAAGVKKGDWIRLNEGSDQRPRQVDDVGPDGWVYTKSGDSLKPGQFTATDAPVAKNLGGLENSSSKPDDPVASFVAGHMGLFTHKPGAGLASSVMRNDAPEAKKAEFEALKAAQPAAVSPAAGTTAAQADGVKPIREVTDAAGIATSALGEDTAAKGRFADFAEAHSGKPASEVQSLLAASEFGPKFAANELTQISDQISKSGAGVASQARANAMPQVEASDSQKLANKIKFQKIRVEQAGAAVSSAQDFDKFGLPIENGPKKQAAKARLQKAEADLAALESTQPQGSTTDAAAPANPVAQTAQTAQTTNVQPATGAQSAATNNAPDIKAIAAKQIPDMTDAELVQMQAHYGPDHKRTAKITKEINRRALASKLKPKPTTKEDASGTQAPEAQQAEAQGPQAPAAAGLTNVQDTPQREAGQAAQAPADQAPQAVGGDATAGLPATGAAAVQADGVKGYALPDVENVFRDWERDNKGPRHPGYEPTARQKVIMDVVEKALDDGVFYNNDMAQRAARELGYTGPIDDGSKFKTDVYLARQTVEAKRKAKKQVDIASELSLKPGDSLGTLVFNDFKVTTGVTVDSISDDGRMVSIVGRRGAATIKGQVDIESVKGAIDRAKERGKRKDAYADYVAGRKQSAAPQPVNTKAKQSKALEHIAKGTAYFGSQDKAQEFITSSGIGDTHEVRNTKPGRFEVVSKDAAKVDTSPERVQKSAENEQVAPFEHAGLKITKRNIKSGDQVESRWVVQSPENAEREARGERQIGGDLIVGSREEAVKRAEQEAKNYASEKARKAEIDRQENEAKAAEEARKAANRGKSILERRADAVLSKEVRDSETGAVMTRAQWVEKRVKAGDRPSVEMVDKIKPMTRAQFNRASNAEQRAHEAKIKAGGKVPEYSLGDYIVSKTEYDYAQKLIAESAPKVEQTEQNAPRSESVVAQKPAAQATAQPEQAEQKATHQDPGEKPEAATKAVVSEAMKTAAKNEETKPSEMRKWLLGEIDKALLNAPDRADYDEAVKRMGEKDAISMYTGNGLLGKNAETGFVTFDVPGDGKFKVRNSVRGLLEFRKNASASKGFKDNGQKPVKPEEVDGVRSGSGGRMAAIVNMIEEGDFEAARDYAEAVGVNLDDVKVPKGERKTEWEMFRKTGVLPPAPFAPSKDWVLTTEPGVAGTRDLVARLARVAGGAEYIAIVRGGIDGSGANYKITKDGQQHSALTSRVPFSEALKMAEGSMPAASSEAPQTTGGKKQQAAPVETNDTGWTSGGQVAGGRLSRIRTIKTDDGRTIVARLFEWAGRYEDGEVIEGSRVLLRIKDTNRAQDRIDAFLDRLIGETPALDLMGFERVPKGNGAFELRDGNMTVLVEPTERGKFQASFRGAKSSPHLMGEQSAVDWAANYREDGSKPNRAPARVTQQISGDPEKFIKVAADSVRELRSVDVDRVLTETPAQFRSEVAGYIRDQRKDLADEVDEVMAEIQPKAAAPVPAPTGSRRDPAKVSMFAPYEDGDVVSIDGQDWTVKQDTPGWYLTTTGNWRGQHPTIRNVKAMADLIREVEQASVARKAAEIEPETPKLTQAEAKSLMEWQDMGQKDGVKTHALTFYESQADKDAKRGRMIVASVTKEVDGRNWMVEGTEEMLAVLGMAKKKAEQVGMARVVADGYVAEDNPFAEYDAVAKQYGYEVRPDGMIGSDGKFPGPKMAVQRGRLRVESGAGNLLGSYAATPESIGKFLEAFWYAEKPAKTAAKPAPEQDSAGRVMRREPTQVSMFNPYQDGEVVSINGEDWTVKQETTGWYLTNTGNWRGTHPTIRNVKAMADLIREVEQAAEAKPAAKAKAPKLTAEDLANQDKALLDGVISVQDYMDATGLTDEDVGVAAGDGLRQQADREAKAADPYHQGIQKMQEALSDQMRVALDAPSYTPPQRKSKEERMGRITRDRATLDMIARGFEHPFDNRYVTKLSPMLKARFTKQWESIKTGEFAKQAFQEASYKLWAQKVIDKAREKLGMAVEPTAPASALASQWNAMTEQQREAIAIRAGWSTAKGGPNFIAKRLVKQAWSEITPGTQATLSRFAQPSATEATAPVAASLNKPHTIDKKRVLTPAGALSADARNSDADSSVWYYQGDIKMLPMTASVKIDGQLSKGADEAKRIVQAVSTAQKKGWELRSYRAGSLGTVWTLEKGDQFLTNAGLENINAEQIADPKIPNYGAGYDNMVRGQKELATALFNWLQTLPKEQRENQSVVSRKMADVLGGWAYIERDKLGVHVRYLPGNKEDGSKAVRWTHTIPMASDWADALQKIEQLAERKFDDAPAAPVAAQQAPEPKAASKTPAIDAHNAVIVAVRDGKATAEQFKAGFEAVVSNKDAIVAELDTMTKVQLLREGGPLVQMRYANEKKAEVVDAVYRQIVGEYALGESVTYSIGKGAYEAAVRKMVEATDADKLARYVTDRKAAVEEMQARRAAKAAAIENPQTLADFREVLNTKIREGMTRKEAFLTLTPQQRIQYDTLEAESTREARENRKRAQKTEVRAAGQTTAGEIVATKHTRDGYDLFVVKLADRLSADDYKTVLASAKKLGGWYSAFRGNGAIPGFQFKDRANADAFLALAGGDTAAAQEQVAQRRDAFEDDRSQTAVERLRAMADKLEDQAAEVEGRERKTNTARRARFASAALNAAAADKAKAKTMRNIADGIEAGRAKFLDEVRTKSQVDMLAGIVETAKGNELRAKYPSYADQEKRKGEPPTAETADFAEFPSYSAFRSDLATLGRQLLEVDGTKKLGQRLMSVADDVTDAYLEFAKTNFHDVSQFGRGDSLADFASKDEAERAIKRSGLTGKAIVLPLKRGQNRVILSPSEAIGRGVWQGDGDKRITLTVDFGNEMVEAIGRRGNKANRLTVPWQFQSAYDRRKALARIGIETPSEFRSALREFIDLKEQAVANRTRELELQMVGRKADGLDFFPTSAEVADQMIEAADLTPDMAVLEPSAGMGHLADRIRQAGAEPDVIEISADRRELLEEKGYHLAEVDDFMQMEPRKFFTYGDVFRAPDGVEGTMRGVGRMGSQRVRLEDAEGNRLGLYDRDELVGVRHMGTWSGYDRIIMNPPFSNRRDAEHVRHAYGLLKPGGRIVAIMGEGVFFGQDKKAQDFREWLESVGGTSEKLPEGSFMDPSLPVNTSVNARMVVIDKTTQADQADGVAMFSRAPSAAPTAATTAQPLRTPAATIRAAITKAYGKLLGQLESKGLVTLTQTEDEAIEAAAQARAAKTGQSVEQARSTLRASVKNSVADQTQTEAFSRGKNSAVENKNAPTSDTSDAFAGRPNNGMQERAVRAVAGSPELAQFSEAGSDAHLSTLRTVDVFGNGNMVEYYDDAKGLMYSMRKYPRGERWTAWDIFPAEEGGNRVIGEFERHHSFADAVKSIRSARISASARARLAKYSAVPNTWNGDAKKLAKALIDAGVPIDRFANSTQSRSRYIYLDDGRKIRLADHDLPSAYDSPDYDYRYGIGSIAQLVERIKSETGNNGNFDPDDLEIRRSADGAIQGFFDPQTGQSFLIADNLTAEAAPGVLMHEVGIHMAADGSMKALFNRAAMMLKMQRGNPFIKAVQARMDAAGETSGEEAAAYIAEAYENDRANAPASVQRWLADLLAAVKAWMFKKGIMGAGRLTVADIAAVARANARSMARGYVTRSKETGAQSLERAMAAFSRVWHGSPHKFLQFDSSKIGTGEGAQAYGHGLYLAESPDVAKSYQSALSADRGFSYGGKTGLTRAEVQDMVNAKYGGGYLDGVIRPSGVADSVMDDMVTGTAYPRQYKPGSQRAKIYDELRGQIQHADPGSLYKVDLPDEAIAKMLDWDKPLSQQAPEVRAMAEAALRSAKRSKSDIDWLMDKPGAQLENFLMPSGNRSEASQRLSEAGIPGIRYLDGGSRGAGAGTYNYVIFPGNEHLLTILDINGVPVGQEVKDQVIGDAINEQEKTGGAAFSRSDQTQTDAFKRWFKDSKVVDAEGNPLVVYHGTNSDLSAFASDRANYFTADPGSASVYAEGFGAPREGANVTPVYLSIQRPKWMPLTDSAKLTAADLTAIKEEGFDGVFGWTLDTGMGGPTPIAREVGTGQRGMDKIVTEAIPLSPEQIKSSIGNNGNFDPTNPDIRFSRADTAGVAARMGDAIKSVTATNIKQRAGFKLTDYLGLGLQALGRRQIVDIYGDLVPLAEYNRLVQQMEADKNEGGAEADQLVTRWSKLPDEKKLADLMHDATLAQIDPAKPYVGGDDKAKYAMLAGRFNALSQEAKQVYTDTRDAYQAHHANVRSAIKERIERSEIKGERKAALLKQMDDEFFKAIKGVYFPLARFGQYAVTVKGPDGKVESVSRAETKAEAEALRNNLLSAFPRDKGFTVGRVMLSKDFIADRDAVGRGFMTELYQVLDKQDMDAAQRAELEDTLGQLYLSSLPDLSWAKHGIHRKGTPGFSQDARRAFAQNMFHGARYLAKLRYSDLMQDELTAMQKHVDDWREVEDFDQNSAQRVVDEMNKRHESLMNPKSNALSTALTSLGFVFHLGLSPASAIVNLTQTAMVAYPIMGAKWGFDKSAGALMKASKEAASNRNDISKVLTGDERRAYDEAVRSGVVDVTQAHDLAGISQGEDAKVTWKLRPVMRAASFLFHHAEKFNRQVTFVAAYRLARESGAQHSKAYDQAVEATYAGHFDYSASNRPRFMQGNMARVVLLFKQYAQNMIYTLGREAQLSITGTPAEKKEARRALAGLITTHAMGAGVLGLPLVGMLLSVASMLGGDDDEPWDAQTAMQNMLAESLGQKPAEVLAHGLSRLTPWDISGRVALDRLLLPDIQEGLAGTRAVESWMASALGAVAGIAINAGKGMYEISEGRWQRGLEAMMPTALRGPMKAYRYATEGNIDKTGISINDEIGAGGVIGQALGFSPSEARNAQEGRSAIYRADRAIMDRRTHLLHKYGAAAMKQDTEAMDEARAEIQKFNTANPKVRINPMQMAQSVRSRAKRVAESENGIYLPRNRRDAAEAGAFARVE